MEVFSVLVIEDQLNLAQDVKREIEDYFAPEERPDVTVDLETDFDAGDRRVRSGAYDIVVLDLRRDEVGDTAEDIEAGQRAFKRIRDARFVPVVFWTALPDEIADSILPPLITVTKKTSMEEVPQRIQEAIDTGAVAAMKNVGESVENVIRTHMWDEVAPNWTEYSSDTFDSVSQVLVTRIARMLEARNAESFTSHPHHRYIYPPVAMLRAPGDVIRRSEADGTAWYVVLTPACDFVPRRDGTPNADFVIVARARDLTLAEKYQKWSDRPDDGSRWDSLRQNVLMATHTRYNYLPAYRDIPDLVVDLQEVSSVPYAELTEFEVLASLAAPFAEALVSQYSHYVGRIGIPDLDADAIRKRLRAELRS